MATDLIEALEAIREELVCEAEGWQPWSATGTSDVDASARNLLQYLALRRHDLRELQDPLVALGLSSLGRCEGHVQASVDAVLCALDALAGRRSEPRTPPPPIGFAASRELLAARTGALLGPPAGGRSTRIMVTMPTDAARDAALVQEMLGAGMECMRINCAHDTPPQWREMVANLRRAEREAGRHARVVVDLPGPKLRTAAIAPAAQADHKGPYLRLHTGDHLMLTRELGPGEHPIPRVSCPLDDVFTATKRGHHLWFDDGRFGAVVESVNPSAIDLLITTAPPKGAKLRAEKGINLPDAHLDADVLGAHSHEALGFAAEFADSVGLSFVSRARDVEQIHEHLAQQTSRNIGLILKIETRRAVAHIPGLILAALGSERPVGVMIARGDLAVECGYERLAEVQEEILWICQAAHVPVIWATQVLHQLARTGRPSRAEITDAATGVRAECVMLNKGPRIVEAITALDDILSRMRRHHRKNRELLPRLSVSDYRRSLGGGVSPR